jgi:L-ascorbate metabolism protein UlaG (beta-lactamase superfamily)
MKSLGTRAAGERLERMRASSQWRADDRQPGLGGRFANLHPVLPGLRDPHAPFPSLRDFLSKGERRVPLHPLPVADPRADWLKPAAAGLRATWLGHSAVLLEMDGARVLTDPVWGPRASPSRLLGPKRFQPAPVPLKALPKLDAVLISHDHYDHLCMATVLALARQGLPFVTSLGVGAHLQGWGIPASQITELDWWQQHRVPHTGLTVTATPSQHFSGRGLKDRNATLWSGLAIHSQRHAVFFSGDTGLTTQYEAIAQRLGPFDLVMLEVGAFHPAWGDIHLGPHNALKAFGLLRGRAFMPVHWGTFALALHPWDEPAEVLQREAPALGVPLVMPRLGQAFEPRALLEQGPGEAWWRGVDEAGAGARCRPARRMPAPPDAANEDADAAPRAGRTLPWPLD